MAEGILFHTVKIQLAYNGAPFSGFARQPGQLTVQGSLEKALELLYKRSIETTCAGRTDAGVHARSQIVSFDLSGDEFESRPLDTLRRSLNALVDDQITIVSAEEVRPGFSARFDARSREYRYFIHTESSRPVLIDNVVWHVGKSLDVNAMREGAQHLIGEHDFKSFCTAASAVNKPTCRNIFEIVFEFEELIGEPVLVITVTGNAFLHSMVRTLVGTLVAVGLGKKGPEWVGEVLAARDRQAAGETAPAQGLVLWQVDYGTSYIL